LEYFHGVENIGDLPRASVDDVRHLVLEEEARVVGNAGVADDDELGE